MLKLGVELELGSAAMKLHALELLASRNLISRSLKACSLISINTALVSVREISPNMQNLLPSYLRPFLRYPNRGKTRSALMHKGTLSTPKMKCFNLDLRQVWKWPTLVTGSIREIKKRLSSRDQV